MPYRESEIEKIYWTIAEVAEMIYRQTSALRHWEREFKWLRPKKNKNGNRYYVKKDIAIVILINFLVRKGITLDGIREAHDNGYEKDLAEFLADKERNTNEKLIVSGAVMLLTPEECYLPEI